MCGALKIYDFPQEMAMLSAVALSKITRGLYVAGQEAHWFGLAPVLRIAESKHVGIANVRICEVAWS